MESWGWMEEVKSKYALYLAADPVIIKEVMALSVRNINVFQ